MNNNKKNKELMERVAEFITNWNQQEEKVADLGVIVNALLQLPPGQLKKMLTPEVLTVLEKYGFSEG